MYFPFYASPSALSATPRPIATRRISGDPKSFQTSKLADADMVYTITVLYPAGTTFDMDYYLKKHMPLVEEKWKPHGLQHWEVLEFESGPDGKPAPNSVGAVLKFDKKESVGPAIEQAGTEIFADVKNFSNQQPSLAMGKVVGASS